MTLSMGPTINLGSRCLFESRQQISVTKERASVFFGTQSNALEMHMLLHVLDQISLLGNTCTHLTHSDSISSP